MVEVLWWEINRREEDRILEDRWRQLKIVSLFASCEGMRLMVGESYQREIEEATLLKIS